MGTAGKVLKAQGNPVGIAISHSNDANTTSASVLWSYGGKVLEADGRTPGISSEKTAQVIEWYKELYIWSKNPRFAMLPNEAEYGHARAWPARPSAISRLIDVNFIVPDMIAKALAGMPTTRAMAWAEDQVKAAIQGKPETRGK